MTDENNYVIPRDYFRHLCKNCESRDLKIIKYNTLTMLGIPSLRCGVCNSGRHSSFVTHTFRNYATDNLVSKAYAEAVEIALTKPVKQGVVSI